MKKIIIITILAVYGLVFSEQKSLAQNDGWQTDFEKAKKEAAEKKLPILAVFSGSDWCAWCMELEKTIFSKNEFKSFARESVILFQADFPDSKKLPESLTKQNEELAQKYGVETFPTLLILNAEGKVIARTGYRPEGATKYVEHLKGLIKG